MRKIHRILLSVNCHTPGKRAPQVRNYLYWTGLWECVNERHSPISGWAEVGALSPPWAVHPSTGKLWAKSKEVAEQAREPSQ